MGLIKEPKNVNFSVDPTPLKKAEMDLIHAAIAEYYASGKVQTGNVVQEQPATYIRKNKLK